MPPAPLPLATGQPSAPAAQVALVLRNSGVLQPGQVLAPATAHPLIVSNHEPRIVKSLTLRLHPADLGAVTLTVRLKSQEIELRLETESEATLKLLQRDRSVLHDVLQAAGYDADAAALHIVLKPAAETLQAAPPQPSSQPSTGSAHQQSFTPHSQPGSSHPGHRREQEHAQQFQSGQPIHDEATPPPGNRSAGGVFV
jgi:chemotaxis protein MotD